MMETLTQHIVPLRQICASLSSTVLEKLHVSSKLYLYKPWRPIPRLFASLAGLSSVDTVLSRPQFSRLSDVSFKYLLCFDLEEEPTTFACLTGTSPGSVSAQSSESGDDPLPSDAYLMHRDGRLRVTSTFLETFFKHKVEQELCQLHNRGISRTEMYVTITHPIDEIRRRVVRDIVVAGMRRSAPNDVEHS